MSNTDDDTLGLVGQELMDLMNALCDWKITVEGSYVVFTHKRNALTSLRVDRRQYMIATTDGSENYDMFISNHFTA